jgi:hypothetical protein
MSTVAHLRGMTASKIEAEPRPASRAPGLEFASVYRENIGAVTASAHTFQGRGTPRAWLIAIARRVYAGHRAEQAMAAGLVAQLGARLVLGDHDVEDLAGASTRNARGAN